MKLDARIDKMRRAIADGTYDDLNGAKVRATALRVLETFEPGAV